MSQKHKIEVALWGGLKPFADGQDKVEVEAATTGQMLAAVIKKHPGLEDHIEAGVSVAVNGRVIASSLTEPIPEGAEVVIIPQLKGG